MPWLTLNFLPSDRPNGVNEVVCSERTDLSWSAQMGPDQRTLDRRKVEGTVGQPVGGVGRS